MPPLSRLIGTVGRLARDRIARALRRQQRPRPARRARRGARVAPGPVAEDSPGRFGPSATVEVDPGRIGPVRMTYRPDRDGDPDPGEIVWTWVPFEEDDGRGKDRPVLVVAVEPGGTRLAVQLTSRPHRGDRDFVAISSGPWDGRHRPSWVNIDRVMRVHADGMRREAAALAEQEYRRVETALRNRYGWR